RAHGGDGTLAVFVQNLHIKGLGVFPSQLEDVAKLNTALERQGALTFWSWVAFVDLGGFHEFIDLEIAACYQTNDVAVFRICTSDPRGTRDHARIGVDLNAIGIEPTWAHITLDQEWIVLEVGVGGQLKGRRFNAASRRFGASARLPGIKTPASSGSSPGCAIL